MDVHAWALIGVLTLAAYTSGLTLYWTAQRRWRTEKAAFWLVAVSALALHWTLSLLTKGEPVLHLLVVLPGLAVLVSAWLQRRRQLPPD
jgi:lipid-A-disaccharide synthase-like uncharacterized protein